MSDRKEFQTARSAGKAIHQAQRLENATYTAVEVKALTKTAADLAYALGRKETAEEIAAACDAHCLRITEGSAGLTGNELWTHVGLARGWDLASKLSREIGAKEAS